MSASALNPAEGASHSADIPPDLDQVRSAKRRTTVYDQSLATVVEPPEPGIEVEKSSTVDTHVNASRGAPAAVNRLRKQGKSPKGEDIHDEEKENFTPKDAKRTVKRRKRRSIGQQSARRKKRPSSETATSSKQVPSASLSDEGRRSEDVDDIAHDTEDEEGMDAEDEDHREAPALSLSVPGAEPAPAVASGVPKKRRKKRKSIGQNTRQKKSSTTADRRRSRQAATKTLELDDEAVDVPAQHSMEAGSTRKRRSDLAAPRNSSPIPSVERDRISEDEDYENEEQSPEPPTPAAKRKTTKGRRSRDGAGARPEAADRPAPRSKTSFPIVAPRLADFDALPTIHEFGESELDTDEERDQDAEQRAIFDRPNPNVVDVLGQYCRETVQSAIERLSMGAASNRAERKRKRTALEAVGHELNDRLFEMSAAVENRIQLERRTRKAQRVKLELQAQWLEIRKQREAIALRCDEVRQQNWQREKDREEKWAISEAAHKLELEAARTEFHEEDSLEYLLRTVADDVSDTSGPGGLLDRIKTFNGRLERMAGVLENRDV